MVYLVSLHRDVEPLREAQCKDIITTARRLLWSLLRLLSLELDMKSDPIWWTGDKAQCSRVYCHGALIGIYIIERMAGLLCRCLVRLYDSDVAYG